MAVPFQTSAILHVAWSPAKTKKKREGVSLGEELGRMSQKQLDVSGSKHKFDLFYEFEAPQFFDFSEPEPVVES